MIISLIQEGEYMEKEIITLKNTVENLETEFQVVAIESDKKLSYVEQQIELKQIAIEEINQNLKQLVCEADGLDYTVAVVSGIVCGMIDSFFVGELTTESLKSDKEFADNLIENIVHGYAKLLGCNEESFSDTIRNLEHRRPMPQDNSFHGLGISSPIYHHLDDLAHHPTLAGLVAGILAQVLRFGIFLTQKGTKTVGVQTDMKDYFIKQILPLLLGAVLTGVCCWLANIAEKKYEEKNNKELPEPIKKILKLLSKAPAVIPILRLADNWFGHLVSDMAGSSTTAETTGGMGIPGVMLSFLKEISNLPMLKNSDLQKIVDNLFNSDTFGFKLDLRTEIAIVKKQMLPVMINEILVRSFYFIRRLITGVKNNGIENIDWRKTIPFNNKTIVRMMTIATGTFTVIDMADAAIRAGVESAGQPAAFAKGFILRVNFVGVGRFAIAIGADVGMGLKKHSLEKQRLTYYNDTIALAYGSPFMFKADTKWITLDGKETTYAEALAQAEKNVRFYVKAVNAAIATESEILPGYAQKVVVGEQELQKRLKRRDERFNKKAEEN